VSDDTAKTAEALQPTCEHKGQALQCRHWYRFISQMRCFHITSTISSAVWEFKHKNGWSQTNSQGLWNTQFL